MKKILLGLLALSAISFAANPGTPNFADMQINARLEVLPANTNLVIEELLPNGNWQPVTSPALFDHGKIIASPSGPVNVPESNIVKNFRVRRSNNTTIAVGDTRRLGLAFRSVGTKVSGGNLTSGTVVGNPAQPTTIPHTFTLSTIQEILPFGPAIVPFEITSNVPTIASNQLPGIYNRFEDITVTLSQ